MPDARLSLVRPRTLVAALVLTLLLAAVLAVLWIRRDANNRPLFYNAYGRGEMTLFPHWQLNPPPEHDNFGNIWYVDFPLNQCLILVGFDPAALPAGPIPVEAGAEFRRAGHAPFVVHRQPNTLLIRDLRTGAVETRALSPGQAKKFYDLSRSPYKDQVPAARSLAGGGPATAPATRPAGG